MVMKSSLSPKDLAAAVGVSESSLKRWADDGRIHVSRTAGGHRRIAIQEAIRFTREARMPIRRPDLLGLPTLASPADRRLDPHTTFHQKLSEGDAYSAQAILIDLYLSGQSVAAICDGPIRSAMTEIGGAWGHGREGIFIEHRATDLCIHALSVLRLLVSPGSLPESAEEDNQSPRPLALGAAPPEDPYMIPSLMCACVLADAGYRTINIGAHTPMDVLTGAIDTHRPRLVWLACTARDAVPTAEQILGLRRELAAQNTALAVGGQALAELTLPDTAHHIHCRTMSELDKFARGLLPR